MRLEQLFRFDISIQRAYVVVRAEGELDIAAVEALRERVANAARRGPRVVVDLRGVDFIDTYSLRALIADQEVADASVGWSLHVVPGASVQRLLDLVDA